MSGGTKTHQGMTNDGWEELYLLAMSNIRLHLKNKTYLIVLDCDSTKKLSTKVCSTYEKETISNNFYLMRKLYDLCMMDIKNVASFAWL